VVLESVLPQVETRMPFDNGLFDYRLTSIQVTLCNTIDTKTNYN